MISSNYKLTLEVALLNENGLSLATNFILGALCGGGGINILGQPSTTFP